MAVLNSSLLMKMNTSERNTFCRNNICVATIFSTVGKKDSSHYNSSFACAKKLTHYVVDYAKLRLIFDTHEVERDIVDQTELRFVIDTGEIVRDIYD